MSDLIRIIENSKNPAMGGGRKNVRVPSGLSVSTRIARPASASRVFSASASPVPHAFAAAAAVKGRIGSCATRPASRSLKSMARILNSTSEGGAPWGNLFSRSTSEA